MVALGKGFQEVVYQRASEIQFKYAGMNFAREFNLKIYYRNEEAGERRVDFFVERIIMVELKALVNLENVPFA
ncbi:MAG TPA: GxxExxY protein [Chitinophagaceae bacterium]|jgi:GxxExxY protein|nr:GxxExxY protein [Chitinophagaceae bacterium]